MKAVSVDRGRADLSAWPYTMPVVAQVVEEGLNLSPGLTILIGQNGSGKSTLVEGLAAAWGRRITAFRSDWLQRAAAESSREDSDLNRSMRLHYTVGGATGGLFLRAERLHAQADWFSGGGRWGERMGGIDVLARSHGEGFLEILAAMVSDPGLYVLDEPESALSFDSCLVLLTLMSQMLAAGSQIVLATHSPILAAMPGALLLQLDESGIRPVDYDETDLVTSWRGFLASPERFLGHLT
ncbi:predicted ATPase [Jatrophihabitans sp. GAS493]|nr:predicted ATPase [Jatrophihabitans sp. GAS493]